MHSTAPVRRSLTSVVSHTPSRIPHLRFHITQHRAQSAQIKQNGVKQTRYEQRCQSTIAHAADADRNAPMPRAKAKILKYIKSQITTEDRANHTVLPSQQKMEQMLQFSDMFNILHDGVPDRILAGLMSESIGTPFLESAPDHLFNNALFALNPEYFIEPYKDAYRHVRTNRKTTPLKTYRSMNERLSNFTAYLNRIITVRRSAGKKLDADACRHVLKWAASLGNEEMASLTMKVIMPQDGVQADLDSYNYYCHTLVWANAYTTAAGYHLRVLPRSVEIRGSYSRPSELVGHRTANPDKGFMGVRKQVLDAFKHSMDTDQPANEMTFVNLMVAMGREADLDGVNSILRSVWNIDINLLKTFDEEEIESPTTYDEGHHLRPTEKLLFAVVHIFCINSEIPTAWQLMDFISRNYNIPIPARVWTQMLEWSHVLSLRRSKRQREQGYAAGKIAPSTFTQMYNIMMDEPHNVKPTPGIHYLLSRNWRDRGQLNNTVLHISKLEELVDKRHVRLRRTQDLIMRFVRNAAKSGRHNAFATFDFHELRRRFSRCFLRLQSSLQLLNHAVEMNLLREREWPGSGKLTQWERRALPQFVKQFEPYLPNVLEYKTRGGTVELDCADARNAALFRRFGLDYEAATYLHNALDTEDQAKLSARMESILDVIKPVRHYCFHCETSAHSQKDCPALIEAECVAARESDADNHENLYVLAHRALPRASEHPPDSYLLGRSRLRQSVHILPFS